MLSKQKPFLALVTEYVGVVDPTLKTVMCMFADLRQRKQSMVIENKTLHICAYRQDELVPIGITQQRLQLWDIFP